jgi:hypothetical protein
VTGVSKDLTDATTTTIGVVNLANDTVAGGVVNWCVTATDGTDHQMACGITTYAFVDKAGVETRTITTNASNDSNAVSAGTLSVTWSSSAGGNIRVNADTSLTATVLRLHATFQNHSDNTYTAAAFT